jgi:hypothetical protein
MTTGAPDQSPRELPPEVIRKIRGRYSPLRWAGYVFLGLIALNLYLGATGVDQAVVGIVLGLLMCAAPWWLARRVLHFARFGQIVDGRIVRVRDYGGLLVLVHAQAYVDVDLEYEFQNKVYRWAKSVHKSLDPQKGATVRMIVDPKAPRRRMLHSDVMGRFARS